MVLKKRYYDELTHQLGEALYDLMVEMGVDLDGANDWEEFFLPITSPSYSQLVLQEFRDSIIMAREEGAESIREAMFSANPTLELIEQMKVSNALALLNSPLYSNPSRLNFNIEKDIASGLIVDAVQKITGKEIPRD